MTKPLTLPDDLMVQGSNRWCGPTALAAIGGTTTDEVERMVCRMRGDFKPVVGMRVWEIVTLVRQWADIGPCYGSMIPDMPGVVQLTGNPLCPVVRNMGKVQPTGRAGRGEVFVYEAAVSETLSRWVRRTYKHRDPTAVFMVILTRHVVLVRGMQVLDNSRPRAWLPVTSHRSARKRVDTVLTLNEKE